MAARVLVVEDDYHLRDMIRLGLDGAGYTTAASTGAAAPRAAAQWRPALILLDIRMPGMDGVEVCRRIRSEQCTAAIPIIAVTGGEVPDAMPIDDVLIKPFTILELLRCVRHWIGSPRHEHDGSGIPGVPAVASSVG